MVKILCFCLRLFRSSFILLKISNLWVIFSKTEWLHFEVKKLLNTFFFRYVFMFFIEVIDFMLSLSFVHEGFFSYSFSQNFFFRISVWTNLLFFILRNSLNIIFYGGFYIKSDKSGTLFNYFYFMLYQFIYRASFSSFFALFNHLNYSNHFLKMFTDEKSYFLKNIELFKSVLRATFCKITF